MKWTIPAKTFFLGEYTALYGGPAIVLTTGPCFQLGLSDSTQSTIHPASPAGKLWEMTQHQTQLEWLDPYQGCGGLGASSAQFIGAYLADCYAQDKTPVIDKLLSSYFSCAWNGKGMRPSGYDVIAQGLNECVFIHRQADQVQTYPWVFSDLAFVLIHTNNKMATHEHLQSAQLPNSFTELDKIVLQAQQAFVNGDAQELIWAVSAFHRQLLNLNLVAQTTQKLIDNLQQHPQVYAAKGCGALGADIVLALVPAANVEQVRQDFQQQGCRVLATALDLYRKSALFEINPSKTLEISS